MSAARARVRATGAAVLVLALIAGIGWLLIAPRIAAYQERHRTVAPDTPLAEQCVEDIPDSAERIVLTASDGTKLGGATVGASDAHTAIVLRQGAGQRICQWLPFAAELAEQAGVRVVLFDRRGRGSSPAPADLTKEPDDLQVAVRYAVEHGADRIALLASSMGNSIMFAAVGDLAPTPCAVVSVSPVLVSDVDGSDPRHLPAKVFVVSEERLSGTVESLRTAADDQGAVFESLLLDTGDHSLQLVKNHDDAQRFIIDSVKTCA